MQFVAGIDIGSVATKAVILRGGGVAGRGIADTGADPSAATKTALEQALAEAKTERSALERVVATGYGRKTTELAHERVTEITAAARGAHFVKKSPGVGTIIDLGGQDTKVIALDDAGRVRTFVMNDKCAAGTGKFLEVMAHVLGVALEDIGVLAAQAEKPVRLNATCTVFAESEVISLIHRNVRREEIAAGLHAAIAARILGMARQAGLREPVLFIGGGARNPAMRRALENEFGTKVTVPSDPQFVVATGAALIAEKGSSRTRTSSA